MSLGRTISTFIVKMQVLEKIVMVKREKKFMLEKVVAMV
jgi:hypothetical protein